VKELCGPRRDVEDRSRSDLAAEDVLGPGHARCRIKGGTKNPHTRKEKSAGHKTTGCFNRASRRKKTHGKEKFWNAV